MKKQGKNIEDSNIPLEDGHSGYENNNYEVEQETTQVGKYSKENNTDKDNGNTSENLQDDSVNEENEQKVQITINTDKMVYNEKEKVYYVNDVLETLTGTITEADNVVTMEYSIRNIADDIIKEGTITPLENWRADEFGLVLGKNVITIRATTYSNTYECSLEIYNNCILNMDNTNVDMTDSDNDGVENYVETIYKTDVNSNDTDNDGLSDYIELYEIGTSPTLADTDGNGIPDGEEDADKDGLTNIEEVIRNTCLYAMDTDGDLLTDYAEVMIYNTNPLSDDTDGDGAKDKFEIENNYNPNMREDNFIVKEKVYGDDNYVEIEVVVMGEQISTFKSEVIENCNKINQTTAGYMGNAFDFTLEGEFISATAKFYFDEKYLSKEGINPTIYYLNEEEECLEEIGGVWDGVSNYVTVNLEHFSTYMLLDKTEFDKLWQRNIRPVTDETTRLEVVFAVDVSGSMIGNKLSAVKVALNRFIEALSDDDLMGLVTFNSNANVKSFLSSDKEKMKNIVNSISIGGNTAIYRGISQGISVFSSTPDTYRMLVVITDGEDYPAVDFEKNYAPLLEKAKEKGIVINTVGIDAINTTLMETIAVTTGGEYFYAQNSSEIVDEISDLSRDNIDIKTDSNNDGISDYHTRMICEGKLTTSYGSRIASGVSYEDFQASDDYDGDGIKNGRELIICEGKNGKVYAVIITDMTKADSDSDGINDMDELNKGTDPMVKDVEVYNLDFMTNNDAFCSSILSEDYNNDEVLHAQIVAGNAVLNYKLRYVTDYKISIAEFLRVYINMVSEQKVEEIVKKEIVEMIDADTTTLNGLYMVTGGVIKEGIEEIEDAAEVLKRIDGIVKESNELRSKILAAKDLAAIEGCVDNYELLRDDFINELLSNKIKENIEVKKYMDKYPIEKATGVNFKFSNGFKNALNAIGKGLSIYSFIIEAENTRVEILNTYATIDAMVTCYDDLEDFLLWTYINSENSEMRTAIDEIQLSLIDEKEKRAYAIIDSLSKASEIITPFVVDKILEKLGAYGFAIQAGTAIGDMIFNTSGLCQAALSTIAYGDMAVSMSKVLADCVEYDTWEYYRISGENIQRMQIVSQLRIMGEDSFLELFDENTGIIKWIYSLQGYSRDDIKREIVGRISRVIRICGRIYMNVDDKYGLYVYEN